VDVRYKFAWTNLPPRLLTALARHLNLSPAHPARALQEMYGAQPTEEFVYQARPVLVSCWLAQHPAAVAAVIKNLWCPDTPDFYPPPSGRQSQLDWLASQRSTPRFREVLLEQFTATGQHARPSPYRGRHFL
jgi:hypothetical protein